MNKISEELLWLGSWRYSYSVNFRLSYSRFPDTGILNRNNLVNEISEENQGVDELINF